MKVMEDKSGTNRVRPDLATIDLDSVSVLHFVVVMRRRAFWVIGIVVLAALASSCAGDTGAGPARNLIVFSSDRALPPRSEAGDFDTRRLDLYLMNADGSHVKRLTRNFLTDVFPAVSRDGKKVAFTRDLHGYAQVFIMDLRNRKVRMLTHAHANSGLPAWSPDGRLIAFATDRNAPNEGDGIWVMNADGSAQRPVTRNLRSANDAWPSWAPDGTKLAFARETPSDSAIFVVNVDGSGARRLTRQQQSLDTQPAWSPQGKVIVYESDLFMLPGQLFVMRTDGTGRHQLTDPTVGASSRPSWSSDGKRIVFMASRDHHTDVWTMNADGTGQAQLTRNHGFAGFPGAG
jgi:Tol biopolymer transport system component